jgi:hypothetical protein
VVDAQRRQKALCAEVMAGRSVAQQRKAAASGRVAVNAQFFKRLLTILSM